MPISPIVGVLDVTGTNLSPTEAPADLFVSNNQAPPSGLGAIGDWFFLLGTDQLTIFQKISSGWNPYSTFEGNATNGVSSVQGQINQLQGALTSINAVVATNSQVSYTANTALANQITDLEARVGTSVGSINQTLSTMATAAYVESSISTKIAASTASTNALITSEAQSRANADSAISSIVTDLVAQMSGVQTQSKSEVFIEQSARSTADESLAYQITTVSASIAGVAASVTVEASARATADGHLSANYSITLTAGNVVTGMQLNSSSGGGTTVSSVIFTASVFQIYNGSSGTAVFTVSGGNVNLANTLNVSSSGKVYIGSGSYNDPATQFYVDNAGKLSMGSALTWDGTNLSITGNATFSGTVNVGSGSGQVRITSSSGIQVGGSNSIEITSGGVNSVMRVYGGDGGRIELNTDISGGLPATAFFLPPSGSNEITINAGFMILSGASSIQMLGTNSRILASDGFVGSPSLCFTGETNTGIYRFGAGDMRLVVGGNPIFVVQAAQTVVLNRLKLGDTYVATPPTATGYIMIRDAAGVDYKMLVST